MADVEFEVRAGEGGSLALVVQGAAVVEAATVDELVEPFRVAFERWIAENACGYVFMHAGAVAVDDRVVLLPGSSGAGKTSAVEVMCERGALYLSDDYAVLGEDGLVHPFPRALSKRRWFGRERSDPLAEGYTVAAAPLPPALVCLAPYRLDAVWSPRLLPPGGAVLRMLEHAVPATIAPELVLTLLTKLAADVPVLEGERGEAMAFAEQVERFVREGVSLG